MFPDDDVAQAWFEKQRWWDEPWCPHCGSFNIRPDKSTTQPWRCRNDGCRERFSAKVGTQLYKSKLDYQTWVVAIYLMTTSLKSVSSMKLHRDLDITQKTAWHLTHRIREAFECDSDDRFGGPVEVDETYFGGKRSNMNNARRKELKDTGRGAVEKTAVVGMKDRETNEVRARVVDSTDAKTLHPFIKNNVDKDAMVYTDDANVYDSLSFGHESVKHSVSEYVKGMAHTNGVESFWSGLKRAHKGTFHKISPKHLNRYVQEFAGRHNIRDHDTLEQMEQIVRGLEGKHVPYKGLKKSNGLSSMARA